MSYQKTVAVAAALALAVVAFERSARADEPTTTSSEPQPTRVQHVTSVPNAPMIWSGIFTLAVPYTISVVVGATSHQDADRYLFIPIAGPWIDFAKRPGCPISRSSCVGETAAKVGLGFDGVFQGLGAISIVSGFLWRRQVVVYDTVSFTVTPYAGPTSSGFAATGAF